MMWTSRFRLFLSALAVLALAACGHGFNGNNCQSPIAAENTEQCNPYLERTP
jgi:outer membrane lipopolysaccharide assembly protein LptE/RlpB